MFIKQILSQHRRDFMAIYQCEHCGNELKQSGYDDSHFHNKVVPSFICPKCDNSANLATYQPRTPKHPDGEQV